MFDITAVPLPVFDPGRAILRVARTFCKALARISFLPAGLRLGDARVRLKSALECSQRDTGGAD